MEKNRSRHHTVVLREGMVMYHQKITRFLGHAQRLDLQFEPRSLFMLTWSAELLLKLGDQLDAVTESRAEAKLFQKTQRTLTAVRELLDELDLALDTETTGSKPSTRFLLKAPRFRRLMST